MAVSTLAAEENLRRTGSGIFLWDGDWEEEKSDGMGTSVRGSGSAAVIAVPMGKLDTRLARRCLARKADQRFCIIRHFRNARDTMVT